MEEELEAMHSDAEEGRVWSFGARNGLFPVLAVVQGKDRGTGKKKMKQKGKKRGGSDCGKGRG